MPYRSAAVTAPNRSLRSLGIIRLGVSRPTPRPNRCPSLNVSGAPIAAASPSGGVIILVPTGVSPFIIRQAMRILLLSMPDSFEHTSVITTRMPNGALASLAGNVDPHHDISIADLILVHGRVRATVERLVDTLQPEVVGLSVMTFQ